MNRIRLSALFLLIASPLIAAERLTQFATIDSLLAGVFEGHFTCEEVLEAGDFGLGTFEAVDGEMIVLDGQMYQVRADGSIKSPEPGATTPFAAVVDFEAEDIFGLKDLADMAAFEAVLHEKLPNPNLPYALRLRGTFSHVQTRAPRKQTLPYPTLADAVKDQAVFEREKVSGEMIGFFLPPFVAGINVPGLHLHFLSDERDFGGHVLALNLVKGSLQIDGAHQWELRLPEESDSFQAADLGVDRSAELRAVESGR